MSEAVEKIVQVPISVEYVAKLEAEAAANERVASRQAAWIIKRYYDGLLVAAMPGMSLAAVTPVVADESKTLSEGAVTDAAGNGTGNGTGAVAGAPRSDGKGADGSPWAFGPGSEVEK